MDVIGRKVEESGAKGGGGGRGEAVSDQNRGKGGPIHEDSF